MCKQKRTLMYKLLARAGTHLDLNKIFPEFFSEALKKTRSTCKQKRTLVFKLLARAGTHLDLNKTFGSCRENVRESVNF